jgi:hypothetical protein
MESAVPPLGGGGWTLFDGSRHGPAAPVGNVGAERLSSPETAVALGMEEVEGSVNIPYQRHPREASQASHAGPCRHAFFPESGPGRGRR